jgi:hypothetical protein
MESTYSVEPLSPPPPLLPVEPSLSPISPGEVVESQLFQSDQYFIYLEEHISAHHHRFIHKTTLISFKKNIFMKVSATGGVWGIGAGITTIDASRYSSMCPIQR